MDELIRIGKRKTILISISILLVSLHTIYFYHSGMGSVEIPKLIQQIVRFVLTVGLLYAVYIGLRWARILSIVLFSIGTVGALIGFIWLDNSLFINKVPLMVMIFTYTVASYHFSFSKSFKAFFESKRILRNNS